MNFNNINEYYNNYIDNKDDIILIDVRREDEFSKGHLIGAINIPNEIIENKEFDKNKEIYLYCRTGNRSGEAKEKLLIKGYEVVNIGGILDFK